MKLLKNLLFTSILLVIGCSKKPGQFTINKDYIKLCESFNNRNRVIFSKLIKVKLKDSIPVKYEFDERIELKKTGFFNSYNQTIFFKKKNINHYWLSQAFNSEKKYLFPLNFEKENWYLVGPLPCENKSVTYFIYVDKNNDFNIFTKSYNVSPI